MARKRILGETEKNVLTKSRRRCCLCFWLDGTDAVQKGQIAHLDQNNTNNAETNLVFLCLEHHDEYDGKTRLAKGLREDEVRHWRDELYREMQYRFREDVENQQVKATFEYLEETMADLLAVLRKELKEKPLLRRVSHHSEGAMLRATDSVFLESKKIPDLRLKLNVLVNHGFLDEQPLFYQVNERLVTYLRAT